jgi:hypothetical protein
MTTILVSGAIANKLYNSGAAWTRLSWALGFRALGCRVFFVEQIGRDTCVDDAGAVTTFEQSVNLAYFRQIARQFGLVGSAALIYQDGEQIDGMTYAELLDVAASADLLLNISGHLALEPLLRRLRRKVYIDLDPGFTQFWHVTGSTGPRLAGHDSYFTIGENIGAPGCPIPTGGIRWRRTRQPVVLEQWPVSHGALDRFTTIASWRGPYGPIQHDGRTYGLKAHEFRKFLALPELTQQCFEIALDIHSADWRDLDALRGHGWRIVEPGKTVPDPETFRRYIQTSGAEFSVAQGIYVETQSGWVSDRTVRYLASGKPALVQDTGFSRHYPVGEGLVTFRTRDEAIDGAERIRCDYSAHCRAARSIAEEYFNAPLVLGQLLEQASLGEHASCL